MAVSLRSGLCLLGQLGFQARHSPKKKQLRLVTVRSSSSSSASAGPVQFPTERLNELNELARDILRTSFNTGPSGIVRVNQALQAIVSVGAEWFVEQSQLSWRASNVSAPAFLRRLFERLGATYIKLGQFVASTPSLFPDEYVKEFQNCLDKTPPIPFSEIRTIMQEELKRPLEEVYEYVDSQPLASASVAQVHAARLKGSRTDVVVKVLKPAVQDILRADLNFLYITARVLEFLNPQLRRTSLVAIIGDLRASMMDEVDFRKEADNVEAFRNYLEQAGLLEVANAPIIYQHCSTRRVLTMERLYGVPLTDLNSISSTVANPETTLINALNVWFGSLLGCETFHADVHAGNLLVLQDGRVGFIDFGIVGRISPGTWAAVETFLTSVGSGEYYAMASALNQMGATDQKVDLPGFARDLEKVFKRAQSLDSEIVFRTGETARISVDEQQVNALLLDVVRVSEAYGLRFPREFGLLIKQLLYFDRYTRLLAPDLNLLQDDRLVVGRTSK